jgi:acyl-CoA thioesterase
MDSVLKKRLVAEAAVEGFVTKLGLEIVDVSEGRAVVELLPGPEDENLFGYVHGGAICALMDEAFQLACNSHGTVAVALNISVVFHCPAFKGVRLRAEADEVHLGRRTGTYAIRVVETENQKLVASCQATAYRKNIPLPFLNVPSEASEEGERDPHC